MIDDAWFMMIRLWSYFKYLQPSSCFAWFHNPTDFSFLHYHSTAWAAVCECMWIHQCRAAAPYFSLRNSCKGAPLTEEQPSVTQPQNRRLVWMGYVGPVTGSDMLCSRSRLTTSHDMVMIGTVVICAMPFLTTVLHLGPMRHGHGMSFLVSTATSLAHGDIHS